MQRYCIPHKCGALWGGHSTAFPLLFDIDFCVPALFVLQHVAGIRFRFFLLLSTCWRAAALYSCRAGRRSAVRFFRVILSELCQDAS